MNVNLKLETANFCYVYNKYKVETIKKQKYILPDKNATKKVINITENIDTILVETLNLGKKVFYEENIEDFELLEFVSKYGSFGFMADLPINRYYILDDEVAIRDPFYINYKDGVDLLKIEEYLKFFLPNLTKKEIQNLIKKCKNELHSNTKKETYLTSILNEYLIYSNNYAEPVNMILNYARSLYKNLYATIEHKPVEIFLPFLSTNNLTHNLEDLYYNNSFGFTINYLKQGIDTYYAIQVAQDVRLLKLCNFCHKAFIANNPKAEYDTPQCKNKANVYKSRKKNLTPNLVNTKNGITAKIPSQELSTKTKKSNKK